MDSLQPVEMEEEEHEEVEQRLKIGKQPPPSSKKGAKGAKGAKRAKEVEMQKEKELIKCITKFSALEIMLALIAKYKEKKMKKGISKDPLYVRESIKL